MNEIIEMTCKFCKLENLGHVDFLKDTNNSLHPRCLDCKEYYCSDEIIIFARHKKCYRESQMAITYSKRVIRY